jgi:hypothetical protein
LGWVFVGECHWRPGFAQAPGQHADQYVGADPVVEAVVDGAQWATKACRRYWGELPPEVVAVCAVSPR